MIGTPPWGRRSLLDLVDPAWGGTAEIQPFEGRYWFSYFGGEKKGYETDPLSPPSPDDDRSGQPSEPAAAQGTGNATRLR